MLKEKKYHIGVVTSFIYTIFYIADETSIIKMKIIQNIDFNKQVTDILDDFLSFNNTISFLSLFLGPSPLLSCRTTLIFFQAFVYIKSIKIVGLSGNFFYFYNNYDYILIQNFSGQYSMISKNKKKIFGSYDFIKGFFEKNQKIGLVSKQGHSIEVIHSFILYPNIEKIFTESWKKYKKNNFTSIEKIKSFF